MNQENWRKQVRNAEPRTLPRVLASNQDNQSAIRALQRSKRIERIRRGRYLLRDAGGLSGETPENRELSHLANIAAIADKARKGIVVSHQSAAMLWGLPLVEQPEVVHLAGAFTNNSQVSGVRLHRMRVPEQECRIVSGVPTTSLERTVVDCLRVMIPTHGIVVADAARRVGLDVGKALTINRDLAFPRFRGRAETLLSLADLGAESPGESILRLHLAAVGWPALVTQCEVSTPWDQYFVDLGCRSKRIGFEFDGLGKYHGAALRDEKKREHELRKMGWRIERFLWSDLRRIESLHHGLRALAAEMGVALAVSPGMSALAIA